MRSWIPWMTNRWKKMIDIWQDGAGYIFFQTTISVLQIMSTEVRLIWKNARKGIHIAQGIVSTIRRIRKRELRKGKNIGTWSKRTESDQICC